MGGLSKTMPFTSASSFAASMAISGIPPFNGFFSKLLIIVAAVMARFYLLAALAIGVSIITLASFLKFQRYAFYDKEEFQGKTRPKEVPFQMVLSMIALGIICLLLSVLIFPGFRETVLKPAIDILTDPVKYSYQIIGL
jgi:multicomponent Na+:H+ antiporter subunit D